LIYIVRKTLAVNDSYITVSGQDLHYLFNVKRVDKNDEIHFFSESVLYRAEISEKRKKEAIFKITGSSKIAKPEYIINIVLPFAEMGAVELSIKNGIEAGAHNFILWRSERSNTKKISFERKLPRFETIIESAASQSRRRYHPGLEFKDYSEIANRPGLHLAPHPYSKPIENDIKKVVETSSFDNIYLWIGPEGGFTETETENFKRDHIELFSLNLPILRMETAVTFVSGFVRNALGYNHDITLPE